MNAELFGSVAAVLTTTSFLPQAVQVLRTRNTAGISLTMYAMFVAGVAMWLAYGLMIGAMPVILANLVTFALAAVILTFKALHVLSDRHVLRS
ncbi:SemiSWEET transporter [Parvularcula sp. LCG005]|uniref:SemiSWEET transporter n=1 Tax=Parvularcula sp. LCG005 TaxID=3078805 RepID=UPI00294356CB|nr:SemiSWEET transporter [Parvularcula sp. LCG005]WOI54745.1 SemiSWEET transporter [Parvularcula sp. LCG005]